MNGQIFKFCVKLRYKLREKKKRRKIIPRRHRCRWRWRISDRRCNLWSEYLNSKRERSVSYTEKSNHEEIELEDAMKAPTNQEKITFGFLADFGEKSWSLAHLRRLGRESEEREREQQRNDLRDSGESGEETEWVYFRGGFAVGVFFFLTLCSDLTALILFS